MKTILLGVFLLVGFSKAIAQNVSAVPPKATQAQVDAGTNHSTYVTPRTLAGKSGTSTGTVVYVNEQHFHGKVSISNVVINTITLRTNSHPSENTISLTNSWGSVATNNNSFFDNLAGIAAAATNVQSVLINWTNTSAAAKTITMHARFQRMNSPGDGNVLYVTNKADLLVYRDPAGGGTNFYFMSR